MNSQPLVSIIMPSYNSEKYIKESIESVLEQTYTNWELLITDDKSTDRTVQIVQELCHLDSRVKLYIQSENGGAGLARNNSIEKASGRYIAFLDSDDKWHSDKLEKQIKFMKEGGYAFTYTAYQKFQSKTVKGVVQPPSFTTYKKLLSGNVIGCLTVVYDAYSLGKCYMPLIRKRQDMGLWLNILKRENKAYCLNEVLAYYRIDSGMTQNKFNVFKWQWRFYRDVVKLGLAKSIFYQLQYSFKGMMKYSK